MLEKWLIRPQIRTRARLRLFCFHPAGNGASMYLPWSKSLPPEIELNAIQLPGRENRAKDLPLASLEPVITELEEDVFPLLDRPFAVFGLSMGALVGFEFARRLRRAYGVEPTYIFAASFRAPQAPDRLPPIAHLPEKEFLEKIQERYQAIPEPIWKDHELIKLFLPLLRADFTLVETYSYGDDSPFNCPLSVLFGEEDSTLLPEDISGWKIHTQNHYSEKSFPGGHSFVSSQRGEVIRFLVDQGLDPIRY